MNQTETQTNGHDKGPITRSQAVVIARGARQEGLNAPEIAAVLTRAGYITNRGGPITPSGANQMAMYGKIRVHRKRSAKKRTSRKVVTSPTTTPATGGKQSKWAQEIIKSNLSPEIKVELVFFILNS